MKRLLGFSLIELLISMVVSMIVLGGAIQVLLKSRQNAQEQFQINDIQDNARYVMHVLMQDLFMSGYFGCATLDNADVANTVQNDAGGFISLLPITGYEGAGGITSFPVDLQANAIAGSDAFIIRRADNTNTIAVKEHIPSAANIKIWGTHNFTVGDTLVMTESNCRQISLFQISGPVNSGGASNIFNDTSSGGGSPSGNCTKNIKGNFTCSNTVPSTLQAYSPGSAVMRFMANAYYIGRSPVYAGTQLEDTPVLFKQELSGGTSKKTKSLEMAQGVENMEVIYGVDLNSDGQVNNFLRADQMDIDGNGTIDSAEWTSVVAVRVSLIFRSMQPIYGENQSMVVNGKSYNDRYFRLGFSQTIKLRNHG